MENTVEAIAIKFFIDKNTRQNIQKGQIIQLTEERFLELSGKGKVDFPQKEKADSPIMEKPVYANQKTHKPSVATELPPVTANQVPAKPSANDDKSFNF